MTDYPETITVSITQEHIDAGKRGYATKCPVALAFADALRAAGITEFGYTSCWRQAVVAVHDADEGERVLAEYDPNGAFPWARDYDWNVPVQPATFTFTKVES
jgi:hypothetical protein